MTHTIQLNNTYVSVALTHTCQNAYSYVSILVDHKQI